MDTSILEEALAGRATIVPWTVEQYHLAIDWGALPEDTGCELLEGFVVHKDRAAAGDSPMTVGDRHRMAVLRLSQIAPHFDSQGSFLQLQQPIRIDPNSEPEPDGAVVRGTIEDYRDHPPAPREVLSVIEVSDSSITRDLVSKLRVYATAGIAQYIVADLVSGRVLVHTDPSGNAYRSVAPLAPDETLRIRAGENAFVEIPAERLLP